MQVNSNFRTTIPFKAVYIQPSELPEDDKHVVLLNENKKPLDESIAKKKNRIGEIDVYITAKSDHYEAVIEKHSEKPTAKTPTSEAGKIYNGFKKGVKKLVSLSQPSKRTIDLPYSENSTSEELLENTKNAVRAYILSHIGC